MTKPLVEIKLDSGELLTMGILPGAGERFFLRLDGYDPKRPPTLSLQELGRWLLEAEYMRGIVA